MNIQLGKKYQWMPSYVEEVKLNQMQNEILLQEREYQDIDYSTVNVDKTNPLSLEQIKSNMKMKKKMHESLLA